MALTSDIVESWRRPAVVVRRLRRAGKSEPFAFTFLFVPPKILLDGRRIDKRNAGRDGFVDLDAVLFVGRSRRIGDI